MLPKFKCVVPRSIKEVLSLLSENECKVIAGGTDLLVELQDKEAAPLLVDITKISELIWRPEERVGVISPLFTHGFVAESPVFKDMFPSLAIACSKVGSPQIRNMGTIGGNIGNASPAADSIPPLMIYDAKVRLLSASNERELTLEELLVDAYKTQIRKDEIIASVSITPMEGYRQGYKRLTIREALALSRLSVAYAIKEEKEKWLDVKIAIGSVTPVCFRARELERALSEQIKDRDLLDEAIALTISRIRGQVGARETHKFKLPILKNLLREILWGGSWE